MGEKTEALIAPMDIGDKASGNYTEIETDGTTQAKGDATCWDDLVGSLIARRLESTAGTLTYNYDESTITMGTGGDITDSRDRLIFNYQKPHSASADTSFNLHIHWEQIDSTPREFTVQHRIQENGKAKATAWITDIITTDVDVVFPYIGDTMNQISALVSVDLSAVGVSSTVQFRLARTDSVAGDIEATFVDAHVKYDMLGSRTEYVK